MSKEVKGGQANAVVVANGSPDELYEIGKQCVDHYRKVYKAAYCVVFGSQKDHDVASFEGLRDATASKCWISIVGVPLDGGDYQRVDSGKNSYWADRCPGGYYSHPSAPPPTETVRLTGPTFVYDKKSSLPMPKPAAIPAAGGDAFSLSVRGGRKLDLRIEGADAAKYVSCGENGIAAASYTQGISKDNGGPVPAGNVRFVTLGNILALSWAMPGGRQERAGAAKNFLDLGWGPAVLSQSPDRTRGSFAAATWVKSGPSEGGAESAKDNVSPITVTGTFSCRSRR
ncbi:hypothetical protein [Micromonospora sp. DPT]|uniref:hypothetical protein n=1 Tax=Micromonospora sp. DPT TaxID=3142975 RepID=UPI003207E29D